MLFGVLSNLLQVKLYNPEQVRKKHKEHISVKVCILFSFFFTTVICHVNKEEAAPLTGCVITD